MNLKKTLSFLFFVLFFISKNINAQNNSNNPQSTAKHEKADTFEYYLTALNTINEANDLTTIFKARPGIIDAVVTLSLHKITIYTEQNMLEKDILEVIKYAGKQVISEKEVTKYY